MSALIGPDDPRFNVCSPREASSVATENAWLQGEVKRLSIARGFWRRFTLALLAIWTVLATVGFLQGAPPSPCLRGRPQPAYSPPTPPGVRGAPWSVPT